MRFAINVPNFGVFGDARALAELAHEAEETGWDGFFLWDHIGSDWPSPNCDPWLALTAMAMRTERILLGPLVTPLPRRRPWKLARETVTLDRLSNGRLILGVGIGSDFGREFSAYGESPDDKLHGEMLDEGLDVLSGLWSGETFNYAGKHYTIHEARYDPTPLQQPRIPIWVAGIWPNKRPFRRAALWDGVAPILNDQQPMTPDIIRDVLAYTREQRAAAGIDASQPYDVIAAGYVGEMEPAAATTLLDEYAEAGLTWWQEGFLPDETSLDIVHARIRQGPPHTSR